MIFKGPSLLVGKYWTRLLWPIRPLRILEAVRARGLLLKLILKRLKIMWIRISWTEP